MSLRSKLGRTLVIGLAGLSALATARAAEPSYKLALTVPLGGADRWDYLSADPATHHVFIAHGTEATVVDGRTGTIAGRIGGLDGAHSIVIVPESRHGYANSGKRSTMTEFDLDSLKPLKEIAIGTGSDAMIYDPASKRVFVMLGEAGNVAVVDTATDTLAATIPVGGKLEFPALDGTGKLFINNEDKREIVRIDTRSAKVDATWPISSCESPHGLAIDPSTHRLFSSCVNKQLVVLDTNDGHIVASLPIGGGSDAVAFDPKRKLVFSSNGEGSLSIIAEAAPDKFTPLGEVPTALGARTMTLDPETGRLYLVTAEIEKPGPPRPSFKSGTAKLLMFDPVP